jgi:UTRA domain-containing protein
MMTAGYAERDGPAPGRLPVQILADRIAVGLTRREPGYPLPRRTALARRFQVTPAEVDAAVDELIRRHLLRRLPTGQVHRAGPAELLVSLDGLSGIFSLIDPMQHELSCAAVRTSRLRAPAEVAEALRLPPGALVSVRRCLWIADGEPAAIVATNVAYEHSGLLTGPPMLARPPGRAGQPGPAAAQPGRTDAQPAGQPGTWPAGQPPGAPRGGHPGAPPAGLDGVPGAAPLLALRPGAVRIEIQAPVRSVARRLRLASGTPAVIVRERLDLPSRDGGAPPEPVALTVSVFRPDLFRIVLQTQNLFADAHQQESSPHVV